MLVVNDALVALEAGAPGKPGVVIISGTGSIAYGRNGEREAARAGGWGYVLGDEGSGYWIGRAALRAVLREADQRGPETALTPLLLKYFGIEAAQGLLHEVYSGNLRPSAIGALAQWVESAFREGDSAAIGILRGAANELEASGLSVARRLGLIGDAVHLRPVRRDLPGGAVAARGARAPAAAGRARQPHRAARRASRPPAPSRSPFRKPPAERGFRSTNVR